MKIDNFKDTDVNAIAELFRLSFGKEISKEFWEWRYKKNITGKIMIKLMWEDDILTGHYAVSPVNMLVNNKIVLSGLSMTTMTHPDYTGQGIFTTLANELYNSESKNNGLQLVWGFPNINSHFGFIKYLSWSDLIQIPSFSAEIHNLNFGTNDSSEVYHLKRFNESHEKTINNLTSEYKIKIFRTSEYLNWRYIENPLFDYNIFGYTSGAEHYYVVTKLFDNKGQNEIDLVEICLPPDIKLIQTFLSNIQSFYKESEVKKFNTWMPFKDKKHILFERLGFIDTSPITYFGFRKFDPGLDISDPSDWFFSMGDSDIF
jgi:hypothetical protein